MNTFYIENFGCRAARADGEAVTARLQGEGMTESALAQANVVVLNTCSVTAQADRDARAFLRKTNRLNPSAKVVITGCYAQRAPEEIAALNGVSAVIGNSHKGLIPEIIRDLLNPQGPAIPPQFVPATSILKNSSTAAVWADDTFAHSDIENAQVHPGLQTRPNLKIQEGCNNRCTFCIIPTTRGHSRSLAAARIFAQIEGFLAAGGKELVLSGINLGRWGRDFPAGTDHNSFPTLLRAIFEQTALPRLRLSSIEPMDWTSELIALMRNFGGSRLARHAHLPLQSGSDAVLRRMHRRYRPWHYAEKVAQLISAAGPELALGADVMVGFPGETDAEFRETHDFIQTQPFTYLHLFPFSPRPGTPGWELHLKSPVPSQAVKERMATLRDLINFKSSAFRTTFIGQTLSAITLNSSESLTAAGRTSALTDNFLPIEICASLPANQLVVVKVSSVFASGNLLADATAEACSQENQLAATARKPQSPSKPGRPGSASTPLRSANAERLPLSPKAR